MSEVKEEKSEVILIVSEQMKNLKIASQQAILNVYENMNELVEKANDLHIRKDSTKEEYLEAKKLWRLIKDTHVSIEAKRKELKAPMVEFGKKLDSFVKEIYTPLKESESVVREKMKIYEEEAERIKNEKKLEKAKLEAEKEKINNNLIKLNSTLERINKCKIKSEIETIEKELLDTDLESFGDRSDEAGFIIQNLTLTCKTIKNVLPVKIEVEKVVKKIDTTPIERLDKKEKIYDIKSDSETNPKLSSNIKDIKETKETKPIINRREINKISQPKQIQKKETKPLLENGELDFDMVADLQSNNIPIVNEVKYFSEQKSDEILSNSVLPIAINIEGDKDKVERIMTISSLSNYKTNEEYDKYHGLPKNIEVMVEFANGFTAVAQFEFNGIMDEFNKK